MSETFIKGTIRLAFEPGPQADGLKDTAQRACKAWKKSGLKIEVTFLKKLPGNTVDLYNIANIPDPKLTIYKKLDGAVLIGPKSPSLIVPGLTLEDYNAGGFHFRWDISGAEANVAGITGTHYFKITGFTSDDAVDPDIFGRGEIEFVTDGSAEGSAPALDASYPPTYQELVSSLIAEMRKQTYLAMKAGVPNNINDPAKRRIFDVGADGTPVDDIINP